MPLHSMVLMDLDRTPAKVDNLLGALATIDAAHQQIHEGNSYHVSVMDLALANNGVVEMLGQVSADSQALVSFRASAGGDVLFALYEAPTFSDAGIAVTPINRNRSSTNTSGLTVTGTPTLLTDGTLLADDLIIGGSGGGASGGSADVFDEWILKTNTAYLMRLTNISGQTRKVFASLNWNEPGAPVTT